MSGQWPWQDQRRLQAPPLFNVACSQKNDSPVAVAAVLALQLPSHAAVAAMVWTKQQQLALAR